MLQSVKSCFDSLGEDVEVCVLTYDTSLTFYNVSQNGEISIMHVGEVDSPFVPLPVHKLMMDVGKDRERIDVVVDKIYNMFGQV